MTSTFSSLSLNDDEHDQGSSQIWTKVHKNALTILEQKFDWNIQISLPELKRVGSVFRMRKIEDTDTDSILVKTDKIIEYLDMNFHKFLQLYTIPTIKPTKSITSLPTIQKYLNTLGYNHLGHQFFPVKKSTFTIRKCHLLAKEIISSGLPIKCLEAVIVCIHLTNPIPVKRFTLSFRSRIGDEVYRHIVLVLRWESRYGVLGLSRREDLGFKELVYMSLSDLIWEFKKSYENNFHVLEKIKIGSIIPTDHLSTALIPWKFKSITISENWKSVAKSIDYLSKDLR